MGVFWGSGDVFGFLDTIQIVYRHYEQFQYVHVCTEYEIVLSPSLYLQYVQIQSVAKNAGRTLANVLHVSEALIGTQSKPCQPGTSSQADREILGPLIQAESYSD